MNAEFIVVLATVADEETGIALAKALVDEHLSACVQVIPGGTTVYRWQDALYVEHQVQLVIKTSTAAWPALQSRWAALHTDEVPELVALPIVDGPPAYLSWMRESATAIDRKQEN